MDVNKATYWRNRWDNHLVSQIVSQLDINFKKERLTTTQNHFLLAKQQRHTEESHADDWITLIVFQPMKCFENNDNKRLLHNLTRAVSYDSYRVCYEQHFKKKWINLYASSGRLNLNGLHLSVYPTFGSSKHNNLLSKQNRKSKLWWKLSPQIITLNWAPTPFPLPRLHLFLNEHQVKKKWNTCMSHGQLCLITSNCYSHRSIKIETP